MADATSNGNKPSSFTLEIRNLPVELEKSGFTSMFSEYGKVTGSLLITKGSTPSYISYATYGEAERAFNALHDQPPLNLKIRFREKGLTNLQQQEKIDVDLTRPFVDHRYSPYELDSSNQRKTIGTGKPNCTPSSMDGKTYTIDDELLYPVPADSNSFNPYDSKGPYHETNLMYTRGVTKVTSDGRRMIAYGRGCTYYELPEPRFNTSEMVARVCERREKGLYECIEEEMEEKVENCKVCAMPTTSWCQQCGVAFYCSRKCQVKDWPAHKPDCHRVPPLMKKVMKNANRVANGHASISPPSHVSSNASSALRRPKEDHAVGQETNAHHQQQQQQQSPKSADTRRPHQTDNGAVRQQQQQGSRPQGQSQRGGYHQQGNRQQQQQNSDARQERKPTPTSPPKQQQQPSQQHDFASQKSAGSFKADSLSFSSTTKQQSQSAAVKASREPPRDDSFIPRDRFVEASITTPIGQGAYYISKADDLTKLDELTERLKNYAAQQRMVKPVEGEIFLVNSDDIWLRARIVKLEEKLMKVFYVDFGIDADLPLAQVCPLSDEYLAMPLLSRKIKVQEGASEKLKRLTGERPIMVKALSVCEDGTFVVEIKEVAEADGEQKKATSPPSDSAVIAEKLSSIPNVLDAMKPGQSGLTLVHAELSAGEFGISVIKEDNMNDFQRLLDADFSADCSAQLEKYPSYSPRVGELVCGKITEDWFRGVVLTTQPRVKMAVIDDARVGQPDVCTPLPAKYLEIVAFGVVFKCAPGTKFPEDSLSFEVTERTKDAITIKIRNETGDFSVVGSLKKWFPKAEQKALAWASLKSGNEVKIMDYANPNVFCVRILETEEKERADKLDQDIAGCALNKKPLAERPVVGQMVLSYFDIDGNYYRAIVTKIGDDGKEFEIKYIDFGNNHKVTMQQLYELPEEFKEQPSCIAKVSLKGVPADKPLNDDANGLIQQLIGHEAALICTFGGHPLDDGVQLKTVARNEDINAKLIELLKPSWEKENPADVKEVYTMDNCPPHKLGAIGDEVSALPMAYLEDGNLLMLGPNDMVLAEAQEQLDHRIKAYVQTTDTHYIPRENELCIAKFGDDYYRAICLESSATPTKCRVLFMDWGNTEDVEHKDVRMITKDFLEIPAYVTPCSLSAICSINPEHEKVRKRLAEIIKMNDPISVKLLEFEDDILNVDIPKIRAQLMDEKLI